MMFATGFSNKFSLVCRSKGRCFGLKTKSLNWTWYLLVKNENKMFEASESLKKVSLDLVFLKLTLNCKKIREINLYADVFGVFHTSFLNRISNTCFGRVTNYWKISHNLCSEWRHLVVAFHGISILCSVLFDDSIVSIDIFHSKGWESLLLQKKKSFLNHFICIAEQTFVFSFPFFLSIHL